MSTLSELTKKIITFRDERDWKQFHDAKEMSYSLMVEAAELAQHFQWKNRNDIESYVEKHRAEIADEVADVLYALLILAHDIGIDVSQAFDNKMKKNIEKYPVEKAKGSNKKYSEL